MNPRILSRLLALLTFLAAFNSSVAAELTITTTRRDTGEVVPARIHLAGPDGKPVQAADNLPFWADHVSAPGSAVFNVPPGRYAVTVERGPEWSSESGVVEIATGQAAASASFALNRLFNLPAEGWWPGEMHIHRPLDQADLLMHAEDLHFGQVISWWNTANQWTNTPLPVPLTRQFDGNRFAHLMGGEDERDGGALLFFNLPRPIDITAGRQHHPSSLGYAQQAKAAGAWIDIEKPFWWDTPMWVAHGIGDSVGIANNHMHRGGVYPGEAWGRARDVTKYPGPHGNGLWTQDIYYHLLNGGLRIPPSAGAASGVLPNPVGYNRAYVQFDGEPTMEKWLGGLKAGRVFVSNGPLLRLKANGQLPGHVFQANQATLDLTIDGQLDSRDPIARIELVRNGRVEEIKLPAKVTLTESGWFLVRAITTLTNTFRFASTGPFYVELNGAKQSPRQREAADFFLKWCDERLATLNTNAQLNAEQRNQVMRPWREARAFWQTKADARADGSQRRPPADPKETAAWLNDMIDHAFTRDEMRQVTGFDDARLTQELARLPRREPPARGVVRILPYPGGRHPRIGFLEGALAPQRETKVSVFTPWDPASYVVVDVPEAVWSNLGLTYLAHTHIDTVWDKQGAMLPPLEWRRHADSSLSHERTLPNGIAFGATVKTAGKDAVEMELWLKNGTTEKLTDLRIQNCVMLKGATGFTVQSNDNKRIDKPFVVARSADGRRWIITAWERCHNPWANPPVPCIHSDPKFPDLAPGETGRIKGWVWFYEGMDVDARLRALKEAIAGRSSGG